MKPANHHSGSWYWVFLLPVVFIGFFWTLDELNIDEDVYVPALAMTGIALTVILSVRMSRARKYGTGERFSWWPWLFVGPVLFILLVSAVDELRIAEELYIPAFVFTFIASIVVFTRRPTVNMEAVVPATPAQLAAAQVTPAPAEPAKKSASWIWALLIPMAAVTVVAVTGILTKADLERRRLDAEHTVRLQGPAWHDMVVEAQRENQAARHEAERALRDAEREVAVIQRRMQRIRQEVSDEQLQHLLIEEEKNKQQLEEARQLVAEAKNDTRRSLDEARQHLEDVVQDRDLNISIEHVAVDEEGLNVRVVREDRPLIVRWNADGVKVAAADSSAAAADVDSTSGAEEDCEVVAEVDEANWEQEDNDWSEVASELHGALFADDGDAPNLVVKLKAEGEDKTEWHKEWETCLSRDKPAWILEDDDYSARRPRMVVTIGPYKTQRECKAMRDDQIAEAVTAYASAYLDAEGAQITPWYGAAKLRLPKKRLREYIKDEYYGIHQSSTEGVGDLPVIYTLLEFDRDFGEKLVATHRHQSVSLARLAHAGIGSLGILGVLACSLGYFKLDEQSAGKKRGRLRLGTFALITLITLVCGSAFLMVPFI